jgi:hypothetical protein
MPFSFKKFFGLSKKESPKKESPKKESAPKNYDTSAAKEASKIRGNLRAEREATRRAEREAATATRRAAREAATATRKAATNARQAARDEWKERVKDEIEPLIAEVVKHNAEIKLLEFIREYKAVHNKKPDVDTIKDSFIQLKKLEILNINDTVMIPSIMNKTSIEDIKMELINMKISEGTNANLPTGGRRMKKRN